MWPTNSKAREMRRNLNRTWTMSMSHPSWQVEMASQAEGPMWRAKARCRGVNMTDVSEGHIPWEDAGWAKFRRMISRWLEMRLDKSALEPAAPWMPSLLSYLGTFIHEFFPHLYPSLKYHLLLEVTAVNIIYAWVLYHNKIINYFKSRMMSLIIYNPQQYPEGYFA